MMQFESQEKVLEACLALQALIVRHQGGKLARLVQARSQQPWDLLDHGLTGQESAVLLGCNRTGQAVVASCVCCSLLITDLGQSK